MSLAEQQRQQKEIEEIIAGRIWVITGHKMDECRRDAATVMFTLMDRGYLIKKEKVPQ
jgi:hypothetical protein